MRQRACAAAIAIVIALTVTATSTAQTAPAPTQAGPTVDQLISLRRVGSPAISPDGKLVAYTVREANWDENAYETEIWIADVAGGTPRQLTSAKKSSGSPKWAPDGARIAFTSDRSDKQQIWLIRPSFGEAEQLTHESEGVGAFDWSPDGKQIAFTMMDPKPEGWKDRDKKYGEFESVDEDHRLSQLWTVDVESKKTRRLTKGSFTVGSFDWSPDGKAIAFDHASAAASCGCDAVPPLGWTPEVSEPEPAASHVRPLRMRREDLGLV